MSAAFSDSSDEFQSTPDLINRENRWQLIILIAMKQFQSTPDLINRENGFRRKQRRD